MFFFQAEDGIRDLVRSRGLGDVYKRQIYKLQPLFSYAFKGFIDEKSSSEKINSFFELIKDSGDEFINQTKNKQTGAYPTFCLLYTSDAADERSSVDLGGRRIIKKKKQM